MIFFAELGYQDMDAAVSLDSPLHLHSHMCRRLKRAGFAPGFPPSALDPKNYHYAYCYVTMALGAQVEGAASELSSGECSPACCPQIYPAAESAT